MKKKKESFSRATKVMCAHRFAFSRTFTLGEKGQGGGEVRKKKRMTKQERQRRRAKKSSQSRRTLRKTTDCTTVKLKEHKSRFTENSRKTLIMEKLYILLYKVYDHFYFFLISWYNRHFSVIVVVFSLRFFFTGERGEKDKKFVFPFPSYLFRFN